MPDGPLRRRRFDDASLVNLANLLTGARLLLVPAVASALIAERFRLALGIFLVCGVTDLLDGLIARRRRQRTAVGFYLDPIADKLLMATSFVVLAIVKVIPGWLTVLVISRDVFILSGSVLVLLLVGSGGVGATRLSKGNTAVQVGTVLYFLAAGAFPGLFPRVVPGGAEGISRAVVWLCAASTLLSGVQYLFLGIRTLSRTGTG